MVLAKSLKYESDITLLLYNYWTQTGSKCYNIAVAQAAQMLLTLRCHCISGTYCADMCYENCNTNYYSTFCISLNLIYEA